MKQETIELVAHIGKLVRETWPKVKKENRLSSVQHAFQAYSNIVTNEKDRIHITIHTGQYTKEQIWLTIDGELGVYYLGDQEIEPICISLLKTRTVQIVKTFQVEVPVTGSETLDELFSLSNDYTATLTDVKLEEISNED